MKNQADFLFMDKNQSLLQRVLWLIVGVVRYAQSTKKKTSLQYLCNISKKRGGINMNFCTDELQSFLQIDAIILVGMARYA